MVSISNGQQTLLTGSRGRAGADISSFQCEWNRCRLDWHRPVVLHGGERSLQRSAKVKYIKLLWLIK